MEKKTKQNDQVIKEQLERTHRELSVLYNISNALRTTLELDHVLYIILTGVTAHTGLGFNRALLFLVNSQTRHLEAKMAIGPESREHAWQIWKHVAEHEPELEDLIAKDKLYIASTSSKLFTKVKDLKFPLDPQENHLLTKAYHMGCPLTLNEQDLHQHSDDPLVNVFQTSEMVIMPLKAKDKVKGLIVADNFFTQKPITDDDLKIFEMLANQAGLAIQNSQLYEMVVQKSQKDSLTNLWNHGYFQDKLNEEIQKTNGDHTPISLLMIDIDNFKNLNDTHGHHVGDSILRDLAKLLLEQSRDIDYVCRYGGEEFSIILTQTDKEQAYTIAERIRQNISQQTFTIPNVDQTLMVTASIGLAAFPVDASTQTELVERADKTMYIAKMSGKNQTCVYDKG